MNKFAHMFFCIYEYSVRILKFIIFIRVKLIFKLAC